MQRQDGNHVRGKWRIWSVTLLLFMLLLNACGGGGASSDKSDAKGASSETSTGASGSGGLESVELTWYYPQWNTQRDLKTVEQAINDITTKEIQATIRLKPIENSSYAQKLNTMVASNENFDIAWTSFWMFDYAQNARKGAFLELDGLIDTHMPELKKTLPGVVWEALKVDGKTYGILNYQTITNREGFIVQKQYADKYKLDPASIKQVKDMEPFLTAVKNGEPGIIPFALTRGGSFEVMKNSFNRLEFINNHAIIGIYQDDKELKAIDIIQTPEYKEYTELMHGWFKKGIINQDAANLKSVNDLKKVGKIASVFHNVLKPGRDIEEKASFGGKDIALVHLTEPYVGTNTIIQSMQAISKNSKNPERTLMFLELLNKDERLINLISFGVEGKHYEKVNENTVKLIEGGGYDPNQTWVFGNTFKAFLREGQSQEVRDQTIKENESARPSPILGFTFDPQPVLTEMANIQAVNDQYGPGLDTGTVDPAQFLQEYIDKRKQAGIDKVLGEIQRQLDEWREKTGK
ncbi:ABC transporter substrate-binding protein [Paenibacillus sp. OSY-SE]|uniref:ABC transporter substrate-binding protein n=1 Tax=Paenibacillus sp. OSY-SE TaxID=1196323 RepID=UPI00031BE9B4|nr:ABC transporter substrate-binding protein [Paenibacillus sp. OSY-SE]